MSKTPHHKTRHQLSVDELQARQDEATADFALAIQDEEGRADWSELANETRTEVQDLGHQLEEAAPREPQGQ